MGKNVVLCADGTCNAFGAKSSSNVARLIQYLNLDDAHKQVAMYDQGLGTLESEYQNLERFKQNLERRLGKSDALIPLSPPAHSSRRPRDWPFLAAAMTAGWGLEFNVGQLYTALAESYEEGDRVFLLGFSRGAFTVRALAGFLWRFGVPADRNGARARAVFQRAWPLFRYEFPDEPKVGGSIASLVRAHAGLADCPVHFMGLWDTVKSYGGLRPIMLPHLRHNPAVGCVRHALALDEQRGWFEATSWGWLDSDHPDHREAGHEYPADRIDERDRLLIDQQDIQEVWFTGCHADVGGGNGNTATSDIALRWMLGEANAQGLRLNTDAEEFMLLPAEQERPAKKESRNILWTLVERFERKGIDNSGRWPVLHSARGASARDSQNWRRRVVWVHESAVGRAGAEIPEKCRLQTAYTSRVVRDWQ
jgi:uncharacterized protein (DUF2235 family)